MPDPPAVQPKKKAIAGKQTPGISEAVAVGTAFCPGKKQIDMTHSQTEGLIQHNDPGMPAQVPVPGDAAGNSSVSLAAHNGVPLSQIGDTRCAPRRACVTSVSVHLSRGLPELTLCVCLCCCSNSRKKNVFNGNHSTVDSVVFGCDVCASYEFATPADA